MKLKTWSDFERSFELCTECEKPKKFFVGWFCRGHRTEWNRLTKEIGKKGWGKILGKNYWVNYDE